MAADVSVPATTVEIFCSQFVVEIVVGDDVRLSILIPVSVEISVPGSQGSAQTSEAGDCRAGIFVVAVATQRSLADNALAR